MYIKTISEDALLEELEWLYDVINQPVTELARGLSNQPVTVSRVARRMGGIVVPFAFAVDLKRLFDYARGQQRVSVEFVRTTIEELLSLLHKSPLQDADTARAHVWSVLDERALGVVLRAAQGRSRLSRGQSIELRELTALTGLDAPRAAKLELPTKEVNGVCQYEAAAVIGVIRNAAGPDPFD